jgi:hypothetical protein
LAKGIALGLKQGNPERKVEFEIEGDLVAEGDRRLLVSVLDQLLGNA